MRRHRTLVRSLSPRALTTATLSVLASAFTFGALAAPAVAAPPDGSANYSFQNVVNPADPTFNQELGINNSGLVAGYYGSGATGHPNKGYLVTPNYTTGHFTAENYPGSAQTQVTGLNNVNTNVGFWVNSTGTNNGFVDVDGSFRTANFPHSVFDQLLGVNDHNLAVGFYTDSKGNNHGYTYDIGTSHYSVVTVANFSNITATAINNNGDIAGFGTTFAKGASSPQARPTGT